MKTQDNMEKFYFALVDFLISVLHWIKAPLDKYIWNNMASDYMPYFREIRDDINQEIKRLKADKESSAQEFRELDQSLEINT